MHPCKSEGGIINELTCETNVDVVSLNIFNMGVEVA